MSLTAMKYLSFALSTPTFYITALSFKFCYLEFDHLLLLSDALKFNTTLVKLDLGNNGLKSCVMRFFLAAIEDNKCLADLNVSGNFLDDEFADDLGYLLEENCTLHTVDISNNPIGPESAKNLLRYLLQSNDTLESLGDLSTNLLMGVRNREEIRQCLSLNTSNHERKRRIMDKIQATKQNFINEKDMPAPNDPMQK